MSLLRWVSVSGRIKQIGPRSSIGLKMRNVGLLTALVVAALSTLLSETASAQRWFRRTKVKVQAPTRLDWKYAVTGQSLAEPRDLGFEKPYRSTSQRYDLYAPDRRIVVEPLPLVLFISFRSTPMAWPYVGPTCRREGAIYVEPHGIGNATPVSTRIRAALDCLDDVCKRYPVDPDRTYIAGYSGGASVASMIATRLPEHFGGVVCSSAVFPPPTKPWHLDRLRNRLHVAVIVGEREAAGFQMQHVDGPVLKAFGVPCNVQVIPQLGHSAPPPDAFDRALVWLDRQSSVRDRAARDRPVLRWKDPPTREQWSSAALEDCREMLTNDETIHIGLGLLHELESRWADLPEAIEARKILDEYDAKAERPWIETARRERLSQTAMLAHAYDEAARSVKVSGKATRGTYAAGAIENYRIVIRDGDPEMVREAEARILVLQPLADQLQAVLDANNRSRN